MSAESDYSSLVTQAEKAVASVKDAELRRIAFQKVLDDLLSAAPRNKKSPIVDAKKKGRRQAAPRSKATRGGPNAYVSEMIADGFFKKPKTISQVKAELENRGHHIPLTSLSGPLQKLCQKRTLRRQRLNTKETAKGKGKQVFAYSEW